MYRLLPLVAVLFACPALAANPAKCAQEYSQLPAIMGIKLGMPESAFLSNPVSSRFADDSYSWMKTVGERFYTLVADADATEFITLLFVDGRTAQIAVRWEAPPNILSLIGLLHKRYQLPLSGWRQDPEGSDAMDLECKDFTASAAIEKSDAIFILVEKRLAALRVERRLHRKH